MKTSLVLFGILSLVAASIMMLQASSASYDLSPSEKQLLKNTRRRPTRMGVLLALLLGGLVGTYMFFTESPIGGVSFGILFAGLSILNILQILRLPLNPKYKRVHIGACFCYFLFCVIYSIFSLLYFGN